MAGLRLPRWLGGAVEASSTRAEAVDNLREIKNDLAMETKDAQTQRAATGNIQTYKGTPYVGSWDVDRVVRDGYEKVIWVYKAIDAIADKMSSWPIKVMEGQEPDWRKVDDGVVPLLNAYSNKIDGPAKFFRYRLVSQLLLSKKGVFVEVIPTRGGGIAALNLLPPSRTNIIPDPDTFIAGFEVQLANGDRPVLKPYDPAKKAGVLWIRKPHPLDPYSGITPLEAAGISIDLDFYARLYNLNFLRNDGRAGQLVAVRGDLSPEDAQELKARFSGGMATAGRTTVIEADAISVQDTAISPRDAQYAELRGITKEDLLIALGTPESVIGNASGRTFDNADAEKENWLDVTVLPLSGVVESGFDILTDGGLDDERSVVHDVSGEPVLRRRVELRIEKARQDRAAGLITVDEWRAIAELDPLKRPGTEVLWLPAGLIPVGKDDEVQQAAVDLKPAGGSPPAPGGGPGDPGPGGTPTPGAPGPGMTLAEQALASRQGATLGARIGASQAEQSMWARASFGGFELKGFSADDVVYDEAVLDEIDVAALNRLAGQPKATPDWFINEHRLTAFRYQLDVQQRRSARAAAAELKAASTAASQARYPKGTPGGVGGQFMDMVGGGIGLAVLGGTPTKVKAGNLAPGDVMHTPAVKNKPGSGGVYLVTKVEKTTEGYTKVSARKIDPDGKVGPEQGFATYKKADYAVKAVKGDPTTGTGTEDEPGLAPSKPGMYEEQGTGLQMEVLQDGSAILTGVNGSTTPVDPGTVSKALASPGWTSSAPGTGGDTPELPPQAPSSPFPPAGTVWGDMASGDTLEVLEDGSSVLHGSDGSAQPLATHEALSEWQLHGTWTQLDSVGGDVYDPNSPKGGSNSYAVQPEPSTVYDLTVDDGQGGDSSELHVHADGSSTLHYNDGFSSPQDLDVSQTAAMLNGMYDNPDATVVKTSKVSQPAKADELIALQQSSLDADTAAPDTSSAPIALEAALAKSTGKPAPGTYTAPAGTPNYEAGISLEIAQDGSGTWHYGDGTVSEATPQQVQTALQGPSAFALAPEPQQKTPGWTKIGAGKVKLRNGTELHGVTLNPDGSAHAYISKGTHVHLNADGTTTTHQHAGGDNGKKPHTVDGGSGLPAATAPDAVNLDSEPAAATPKAAPGVYSDGKGNIVTVHPNGLAYTTFAGSGGESTQALPPEIVDQFLQTYGYKPQSPVAGPGAARPGSAFLNKNGKAVLTVLPDGSGVMTFSDGGSDLNITAAQVAGELAHGSYLPPVGPSKQYVNSVNGAKLIVQPDGSGVMIYSQAAGGGFQKIDDVAPLIADPGNNWGSPIGLPGGNTGPKDGVTPAMQAAWDAELATAPAPAHPDAGVYKSPYQTVTIHDDGSVTVAEPDGSAQNTYPAGDPTANTVIKNVAHPPPTSSAEPFVKVTSEPDPDSLPSLQSQKAKLGTTWIADGGSKVEIDGSGKVYYTPAGDTQAMVFAAGSDTALEFIQGLDDPGNGYTQQTAKTSSPTAATPGAVFMNTSQDVLTINADGTSTITGLDGSPVGTYGPELLDAMLASGAWHQPVADNIGDGPYKLPNGDFVIVRGNSVKHQLGSGGPLIDMPKKQAAGLLGAGVLQSSTVAMDGDGNQTFVGFTPPSSGKPANAPAPGSYITASGSKARVSDNGTIVLSGTGFGQEYTYKPGESGYDSIADAINNPAVDGDGWQKKPASSDKAGTYQYSGDGPWVGKTVTVNPDGSVTLPGANGTSETHQFGTVEANNVYALLNGPSYNKLTDDYAATLAPASAPVPANEKAGTYVSDVKTVVIDDGGGVTVWANDDETNPVYYPAGSSDANAYISGVAAHGYQKTKTVDGKAVFYAPPNPKMPTVAGGTKVYLHPSGKAIYVGKPSAVNGVSIMLTYLPNGKQGSTSASPEALANGYGSWVDVTYDLDPQVGLTPNPNAPTLHNPGPNGWTAPKLKKLMDEHVMDGTYTLTSTNGLTYTGVQLATEANPNAGDTGWAGAAGMSGGGKQTAPPGKVWAKKPGGKWVLQPVKGIATVKTEPPNYVAPLKLTPGTYKSKSGSTLVINPDGTGSIDLGGGAQPVSAQAMPNYANMEKSGWTSSAPAAPAAPAASSGSGTVNIKGKDYPVGTYVSSAGAKIQVLPSGQIATVNSKGEGASLSPDPSLQVLELLDTGSGMAPYKLDPNAEPIFPVTMPDAPAPASAPDPMKPKVGDVFHGPLVGGGGFWQATITTGADLSTGQVGTADYVYFDEDGLPATFPDGSPKPVNVGAVWGTGTSGDASPGPLAPSGGMGNAPTPTVAAGTKLLTQGGEVVTVAGNGNAVDENGSVYDAALVQHHLAAGTWSVSGGSGASKVGLWSSKVSDQKVLITSNGDAYLESGITGQITKLPDTQMVDWSQMEQLSGDPALADSMAANLATDGSGNLTPNESGVLYTALGQDGPKAPGVYTSESGGELTIYPDGTGTLTKSPTGAALSGDIFSVEEIDGWLGSGGSPGWTTNGSFVPASSSPQLASPDNSSQAGDLQGTWYSPALGYTVTVGADGSVVTKADGDSGTQSYEPGKADAILQALQDSSLGYSKTSAGLGGSSSGQSGALAPGTKLDYVGGGGNPLTVQSDGTATDDVGNIYDPAVLANGLATGNYEIVSTPGAPDAMNDSPEVFVLKVKAKLLNYPVDYPYPKVLGAPPAKKLPSPKAMKGNSLRPGDVFATNGEGNVSVVKINKKGSGAGMTTRVTYLKPDGTQDWMLLGSTDTVTVIARTPTVAEVQEAQQAQTQLAQLAPPAPPAPAAPSWASNPVLSPTAKAAAKPKPLQSGVIKAGSTILLPGGGSLTLSKAPGYAGPSSYGSWEATGIPSGDVVLGEFTPAHPVTGQPMNYATVNVVDNGDGTVTYQGKSWNNVQFVPKAAVTKKGAYVNGATGNVPPPTPQKTHDTPAPAGSDTPAVGGLPTISTTGWTFQGTKTQAGSNLGGYAIATDGTKYYVKKPKSVTHVENEVLAARLYDAAGMETPTISKAQLDPSILGGGIGVASRVIEGKSDLAQKYTDPAYQKELYDGFAVHAWLANWDAMGTGMDNQKTVNGKPVTIDVGGSLLFRAKGQKKGTDGTPPFGDSVGELTSMTNTGDAGTIFAAITDAQKRDSFIKHVVPVTPAQIDALVASSYSDPAIAAQVAKTLKARRLDMAKQLGVDVKTLPENIVPPVPTVAVPGATVLPVGAFGDINSTQVTLGGKDLWWHTQTVPATKVPVGAAIFLESDPSEPWLVTKVAPKVDGNGAGKMGLWGKKNGTGPEVFMLVQVPSSGERQVAVQSEPAPGWAPPPPPPPPTPGAKLQVQLPATPTSLKPSPGATTKLGEMLSQLNRQTEIGNAYKLATPEQKAILAAAGFGTQSAFVSEFLGISSSWDGSSNDSDTRTLAFHHAVALEFGLDDAAPWGIEQTDMALKSKVNKHFAKYGAAYQAAARLMYQNTQNQFAQRGIKTVTAYRGNNFSPPDKTNGGWGSTPAPPWAWTNGVHTDVTLRPINSFSWVQGKAQSFGSTMLTATIPVEAIFSMGKTGPGLYNGGSEKEITVMGVKGIPWQVTGAVKPQSPTFGIDDYNKKFPEWTPGQYQLKDIRELYAAGMVPYPNNFTEDWIKDGWTFVDADGDDITDVHELQDYYPHTPPLSLLNLPVAKWMPEHLRAQLEAMLDDPSEQMGFGLDLDVQMRSTWARDAADVSLDDGTVVEETKHFGDDDWAGIG